MKKLLISFILLFLFNLQNYADTLKLSDCYTQALEKYPLRKQEAYYQKIAQIKIKNLQTVYYPDISLTGQASWQSDVTKLPIKLPPAFGTIQDQKQDQYKIGFNINETIWDGGVSSSQQDIEKINANVSSGNVEVTMYSLLQNVNDAYFGILMIQNQIKSLQLSKIDLVERLNMLKVRFQNGTVLESSLKIIEAEILKLDQSLDELSANKSTFLNILGELLNTKFDDNIEVEMPQAKEIEALPDNKKRPEYLVFDENRKLINKSVELTDSKYMPKFSAFAQAFYGRPGLNMLDPSFSSYFMVGVKASWSIINWGNNSRENEVLQVQKEIINSNEETFTKNLKISTQKYISDIHKLKDIIDKDLKIIEIRKDVLPQYSNQLDNGVITVTDYLNEFHSQVQSNLTFEGHKIQLIQTTINYLTQIGEIK